MSIYFVGYVFGMLFFGLIVDEFGRWLFVKVGLSLFGISLLVLVFC